MAISIKNNTDSTQTWLGLFFEIDEVRSLSSDILPTWASSDFVLSSIGNADMILVNGSTEITSVNDAINILKGNLVEVSNSIVVSETPPFATPTFRTKRDSTPTILEIAAGDTEVIDYILAEERYVQGGELVYEAAEIGDYISAEIYDPDSIIPEAYRAALCEAWPSVAKYIYKHWINPSKHGQTIDTYPLNAKITPGLALRITYTATNVGSTRKVGINYFLSKKL